MELTLQRLSTGDKSTIGALYIGKGISQYLFCWTCEDQRQSKKTAGETRIPAGRYKIELRKDSPMSYRYSQRFPSHQGMLWLRSIDGFTYVYIHIGNTHENTDGCILTGFGNTLHPSGGGYVADSTMAYLKLYEKCMEAFDNGEEIWIDIRDEVFI